MKFIIYSFISIFIGYSNTGSTAFNNSKYIADEAIINMLGDHFVKDLQSVDIKQKVGAYLVNHMDEVNHVSAHFAKEGDVYYYAVFGTKNGVPKSEYLAVNQAHFEAGTYFNFEAPLSLLPTCRKGNGHPVTCPVQCDNWPLGCLGINCEPYECGGGIEP